MLTAPAAMVLAAGRGERMRPLSFSRAKPALPILGLSLLGRVLRHLGDQGLTRFAVNAHHGKASIARVVATEAPGGARPDLFEEPVLMGTGGALDAPRDLLGSRDGFLLHNSDTLVAAPLDGLRRAAGEGSRRLGALLVRPGATPGYRPIRVEGGRVTSLLGESGDPAAATYLGVALLCRELLERVPRGRPSALFTDIVIPAMEEGWRLATVPYDGPWLEFTSPRSYLDKLLGLIGAKGFARQPGFPGGCPPLTSAPGEETFCGPGVVAGAGATLRGGVILERGAAVGPGARLSSCAVLEGATVGAGARLHRVIVDAGTRLPEGAIFEEGVYGPDPEGAPRFTPFATMAAR